MIFFLFVSGEYSLETSCGIGGMYKRIINQQFTTRYKNDNPLEKFFQPFHDESSFALHLSGANLETNACFDSIIGAPSSAVGDWPSFTKFRFIIMST